MVVLLLCVLLSWIGITLFCFVSVIRTRVALSRIEAELGGLKARLSAGGMETRAAAPVAAEPAAAAPRAETPAPKAYTKEEVRAILADLSQYGFRNEAKALVKKYADGGVQNIYAHTVKLLTETLEHTVDGHIQIHKRHERSKHTDVFSGGRAFVNKKPERL